MKHSYYRTWAEIDIDKIKNNLNCIKKHLKKDTGLIGIVKADAYGHGSVAVAKTIENDVTMFAVSGLDEAIQLRQNNISKQILILGYTPADWAKTLKEEDITQTVFSYEYAKSLYDKAVELNCIFNIHIKIDTGMSRLGFRVQTQDDIKSAVEDIKRTYNDFNSRLKFEGIFTHFAVSDELDNNFTQIQYDKFTEVINKLTECGIKFKWQHCCNSAAILENPEMQLNMVRPGIILYGMMPDDRLKNIGLEPVLSLKSVVAQTHDICKGMTVSYGRTFTANTNMTIATIPIGYADGYSRMLSNSGEMLINGYRAKIIGKVCMDQCMIDVTGIPDVKTGTIVTIIGKDHKEEISASDIASKFSSINYEVTCLIGKRVPRVYISNGKVIDYYCVITD